MSVLVQRVFERGNRRFEEWVAEVESDETPRPNAARARPLTICLCTTAGQPGGRRREPERPGERYDQGRDTGVPVGGAIIVIGVTNVGPAPKTKEEALDRIKKIAANLKATVIIQHDPRDMGKLPAFPAAAK